jgi:FMN phosphatase YigB (HAD superfamily)
MEQQRLVHRVGEDTAATFAAQSAVATIVEKPTRNTDARLDRAFGLVADPSVKALTLDVFDTILFRRVADPVDAFPIVGARLAERGTLVDHIDPLGFKRLRIVAEERARQAAGGPSAEVTLDQIYEQIPRGLFNGADPADAAAVEVEVERGLLGPDLDVLELVRAARAAGKQAVAVSDTYFSEEQLRSFLHPWFTQEVPLDRIFVSSAHGTGKGGRLFDIVLGELGVTAAQVVHVGDNEAADVESPRSRGIRSLLFQRRPKELARVLEREGHYLDLERTNPDGDSGTTAVRGKVLHRRELQELPEELRPFWTYGAVALGPALAGFAEWVQTRAAAAGASKAFCLMREGDLLSDLVTLAGGYLGSGITGEPLWLSRQVTARAAIFEGHAWELGQLLSRRSAPTVAEFCKTLGVAVESAPLLRENAAGRLNDASLAGDVIEELSSNPDLRGPIVQRAGLLRERVLAYVERMLPEGERNLVLVDLGWGGTIQKKLQDVLHRSGSDVHTVGLYLATDERATHQLLEGIDIAGYLAAQGSPSVTMRAVMRSPEILEQVCMPDVGSQLDLDADLQPVLDTAVDADRVQSAERAAVQKGIRAFQREWSRYGALEPLSPRLARPGARRVLLAQVARATAAPTAAEAAAFGRWVHDENFGSAGFEPIVGDAHHRSALRHMDPETLMKLPMSELYWPFGLAALEDEHMAEAIDAVAAGLVPPAVFYSALEAGDVEVYFDNGFGFSADWLVRVEGRRNRFGLSYARAELRGDEVRAVRIDPVRAQCMLRIDWVALTCWVRGEDEPRRLMFDTHEALGRFKMRDLTPAGAKFFMAGWSDPQMELDLRAELGGATAYEVVVELAYAVMLIDPRGEDAAATRELQRRAQERSRAAKRFVRQLENRTGVPIGGPLRKAYRKLRARLGG